ncbi:MULTISPECIES: hypothetical protein [Roseovarius]|uniref:Uncharacterized protein n=2 Tax=Roseovarius TaxID=74030 RepID=A0ABZ2HCM0_9RHOB|nr:hypothetical protein [Roseovarius sp. W115]
MRTFLIASQVLILCCVALIGATSGAQDANACAVNEVPAAGHCQPTR